MDSGETSYRNHFQTYNQTKYSPSFRKRCRPCLQTSRRHLWNSMWELWTQIHWRNKTKPEYSTERTS